MIDELDDVLARALHERGRHVGAPTPRPSDVRRRVVRRRRRRIAVPVTAVLGLAVGLVASRALPQRSTTTVTVDAPAAPSSSTTAATDISTAVSGTTAASVAGPATTAATAAPADVPWFGIDDPNWLPRSAIEVRAPGYLRGRRLLRYRVDADWRSTPAIDVVDRDLTSGDDLPNAESTTIAGRQAWIGRYAESTVVRIALTPTRVAQVEGWGVDEAVLVATAASASLQGDALTLPAPAGLTLLSDVSIAGPHTAHRIVYEAADDPTGQRRLSIMVSSDPTFATTTGDLRSLAGQPAIDTGGGTIGLVDGRWSLGGYVMSLDGGGVEPLPDGVGPLTAAEVGRLAIARVDASTLDAAMPIDAAARRKGDAFAAALPPGFEDVQPRPSNDGSAVGWGALSATDRWIWIELVRATTGDPVGSQAAPVVAREDAHRRVMRWRSPTGWIYELTADGLKADAPPSLTAGQMTAILQAVEAA